MFYVYLNGDMDSIFLPKAYDDSQKNVSTTDSDRVADTEVKNGTSEHEEDERSDVDNLASDGFAVDDDEEDEYDWSNEEDDVPLDFSDDDVTVDLELSKPEQQVNGSKTSNEDVLASVFPDGLHRDLQ
ncbi:Hypothetical predicted protein [Olea europaea subsp. europaea]|uniref:Uncharacterized protein n=1 Tax=Olea europaea subsp. europaea TaxID=158383 RepID=A0A8S0TSA3_OLEEU|nr:Hypothetical predicted protein [Olea europaea subsp. europaea]